MACVRVATILGAVLASALAACGLPGGLRGPGSGGADALQISFSDALAPSAFQRDALVRAEPEGGVPGYWAVVPGLPRPERALIERADGMGRVVVALFAGRAGPGGSLRLSRAAAEALDIGESAAPVRITALRSEARIAAP